MMLLLWRRLHLWQQQSRRPRCRPPYLLRHLQSCSAAHFTAGTTADTNTNSDTYTYALAQRETGIGADNRSGSNPDCSSGSDRVIGSNSTSLVRGWRFRIIRQHSLGRNWCAPDNRTFHRGIPCLQGKAANGQSKSIVEAVVPRQLR